MSANPFKKFWQDSWTKTWGWIKISAGASWLTLGQVLHDTDVKASIPALNLPPWVPTTLAVLGVITLISMQHKDNQCSDSSQSSDQSSTA